MRDSSAPMSTNDYYAATMVPSEGAMLALSDEECIRRLADAIESNDSGKLEEIAALIGRLAVTIE